MIPGLNQILGHEQNSVAICWTWEVWTERPTCAHMERSNFPLAQLILEFFDRRLILFILCASRAHKFVGFRFSQKLGFSSAPKMLRKPADRLGKVVLANEVSIGGQGGDSGPKITKLDGD